MTITIIIITLIALIFISIYVREWFKYRNSEYLTNLDRIKKLFNLLEFHDDYITWKQRNKLLTDYSQQQIFFKNKTNYYRKEKIIEKFNYIINNFEEYIKEYNKIYVQKQKSKYEFFFDEIEQRKLDEQQRNAIITDEYSNLVVAGAGSGKTLTIIGKIKYLIEIKKINPDDILLLSYTKKTVAELNERIIKLNLGCKAQTFHKLGYGIIKSYTHNTPKVASDKKLNNAIKEFFKKDIFDNIKALNSYIQFVACNLNIPIEYDEFNSLGEKFDVEKGIDFKTLKHKYMNLNDKFNSYNNNQIFEEVHNIEELLIANYLFLNGINYIYEKSNIETNQENSFQFNLIDYNISIKHFNIDENSKKNWLTDYNQRKYIDSINKIREYHNKENITLIETYTSFNKDNLLLTKLNSLLIKENINFKPIDKKEVYNRLFKNDIKFGSELEKLIATFINLSKSRQFDSKALLKLYSDKNKTTNKFMLARQLLFVDFAIPILEKYNEILKRENEIDFNDMINKATEFLQKFTPDYNYRYIIIDEYQDISFSRFNLINEIRNLSEAKFVCVGDDWQSIYRFAGSDISLFNKFEKFVGKYELLLIENTYRNSKQIIEISSKFIQKNPYQIQKSPKSTKLSSEFPVKFVQFNNENLVELLLTEIKTIVKQFGNESILILGRHIFDINEILENTQNNNISFDSNTGKLTIKGFEKLNIKYLTVHKSKGIEAGNVIILNLKNNLYGFPNKISDDLILSLLLAEKENFRFSEERRLFYVALTRTKNNVILFYPNDNSIFIDELLTDNNFLLLNQNGNIKPTNCPYCNTGKLVVRMNSNNKDKFLGCSHFPKCNQTFNNLDLLEESYLCSDCKSGFMIKKSGQYGDFLGCTNYRKDSIHSCTNTINIS